MRTTVDLPPAVHRRARAIAMDTGRSLSSVIVELTVRGLAHLDTPVEVRTDERSGMPVVSIGRTITSQDVAEALDDE